MAGLILENFGFLLKNIYFCTIASVMYVYNLWWVTHARASISVNAHWSTEFRWLFLQIAPLFILYFCFCLMWNGIVMMHTFIQRVESKYAIHSGIEQAHSRVPCCCVRVWFKCVFQLIKIMTESVMFEWKWDRISLIMRFFFHSTEWKIALLLKHINCMQYIYISGMYYIGHIFRSMYWNSMRNKYVNCI